MPTKLYAFEAFDPLEGQAPGDVEGKFIEIAFRARRILAGRSRDEILAIADVISWLLSSELIRELNFERMERLAEDLESGTKTYYPDQTEASDLAHCIDKFALNDISPSTPSLRWAELFAVLTLGVIDEVSEWIQYYRLVKFPEDDYAHLDILAPYAVEAMEAVCMAECLVRQEQFKREAEQKIISEKQKAAFARHRATNDLKREFIHYYKIGKFPSYAEAARRFYEALPSDKKKILSPTNATRTLVEALSAYLKNT